MRATIRVDFIKSSLNKYEIKLLFTNNNNVWQYLLQDFIAKLFAQKDAKIASLIYRLIVFVPDCQNNTMNFDICCLFRGTQNQLVRPATWCHKKEIGFVSF